MYQEFYANSNHLFWPLLGLGIFISIFICVMAYVVFGLRNKDKVDELAALPLASDSGTDTAGPGLVAGLDHATGRAS